MRPTAGLTFGGRYQLLSRIAIGGMGEVWEATDLVIGRVIAIKILKDEFMGDPGFLERFRAEARHAALVNHEGIANVYDYGEEEGSAFLVMELVPGEALSTILERERVLSTDRVLDIVAQTSAALHAAHSAGLVHRDIKPGNLLITPDGRVKITDFGIARIADQVPLTATGQVMGTVQYLSPEQASGHPASPSTDIYSIGIVAYESLAGRRPFTGESQVAIAMAQINESPPDLPVTVSEPVRNLVYACLAKDPSDRPASAAHLARAAQALRRGDVAVAAASVPAVLGSNTVTQATALLPQGASDQTTMLLPAGASLPEPTAPVQTTTEKKRNPWTWPLIALIAILLIVLIGGMIALFNRPVTPTAVSPSPSPSVSVTQTPTTPPSTAPTTAEVNASDFETLTSQEATDKLKALGMKVNVEQGNQAPDQGSVDTVYRVNPTGTVPIGSTITIFVYSDIAKPNAPSSPASMQSDPPNTVVAGNEFKITLSSAQCPAGQTLAGYNITVDGGGSLVGENGSTSLNATVKAKDDAAGESIQITYTVICGAQESDPSPGLTVQVVAPPVEPSQPPAGEPAPDQG